MFEVKEAPSKGPMGDHLMVVDEGRDVWLQRITNIGRGEGKAFKLVWGERVIPFDVSHKNVNFDLELPIGAPLQQFEYEGEKQIGVYSFMTFGASGYGSFRGGPSPYEFKNDEEYQEAKLLAVEAILAYGGNYNGYKWPDGFYRFDLSGKFLHDGDQPSYSKKDFAAK